MARKIRTVGCFLEHKGRFLILHRQPHEHQGDTWGLVAGRVEEGESDVEAILRELEEEAGYKATENELELLGELSWDYPDAHVDFPVFRIKLEESIEVIHQPEEHQGYRWVTAEECYSRRDLIRGLHDILEKVGYVKN
jgi:8-oxo-dGTP diphosphatase